MYLSKETDAITGDIRFVVYLDRFDGKGMTKFAEFRTRDDAIQCLLKLHEERYYDTKPAA